MRRHIRVNLIFICLYIIRKKILLLFYRYCSVYGDPKSDINTGSCCDSANGCNDPTVTTRGTILTSCYSFGASNPCTQAINCYVCNLINYLIFGLILSKNFSIFKYYTDSSGNIHSGCDETFS
jgi:hypothetical protein